MKNQISLSARLQAVAGMVTKGNIVCDVGCDHGFVPIYLVQMKISPKVIAMDVNEGPIEAAREHVREYLLTDYIETRRSDGVHALQAGEADTLICAGMGGKLMKRILEEGREKLCGMKELILQPQSEIQSLREYLREKEYRIADENMILEDGKYYPMMRVIPKEAEGCNGAEKTAAECAVNPEERRIMDKYGPVLLQKKHPVLFSFLQREEKICAQISQSLKNSSEQETKQVEIREKMEDIQRAFSYFER